MLLPKGDEGPNLIIFIQSLSTCMARDLRGTRTNDKKRINPKSWHMSKKKAGAIVSTRQIKD
jgi:hypothetical protein